MSAISAAKSTRANLTLSAGTDDSGKTITKNVTLSGLNGNPDGDKLMAVVDLVAPCLAHSVITVTTTEVKSWEKV